MPMLNRNVLHALPTRIPPMKVVEAFDSIVAPVFDSMSALRAWTNSVVQLRDLLLPKLVTGQIDVSSLDLESLVEGAVV